MFLFDILIYSCCEKENPITRLKIENNLSRNVSLQKRIWKPYLKFIPKQSKTKWNIEFWNIYDLRLALYQRFIQMQKEVPLCTASSYHIRESSGWFSLRPMFCRSSVLIPNLWPTLSPKSLRHHWLLYEPHPRLLSFRRETQPVCGKTLDYIFVTFFLLAIQIKRLVRYGNFNATVKSVNYSLRGISFIVCFEFYSM